MSMTGNYLDQTGERVPYHFTTELFRRERAVEIWVAVKSLGKTGISELIERNCKQAEKFAIELKNAGYEILNDVVINQVLVSFGSEAVTDKVVEEIQKDGTCWMGTTTFQGKRAMRISVSSWATTDEDVNKSIEAILSIAKRFS